MQRRVRRRVVKTGNLSHAGTNRCEQPILRQNQTQRYTPVALRSVHLSGSSWSLSNSLANRFRPHSIGRVPAPIGDLAVLSAAQRPPGLAAKEAARARQHFCRSAASTCEEALPAYANASTKGARLSARCPEKPSALRAADFRMFVDTINFHTLASIPCQRPRRIAPGTARRAASGPTCPEAGSGTKRCSASGVGGGSGTWNLAVELRSRTRWARPRPYFGGF